MGQNITIEEVRQSLLKQRDEIEEKIKALDKALDIVENVALNQNNLSIKDDVGNANEFIKDMKLVDAAKSIFENNQDKEYFVGDIEKRLKKGGVKGKYGYNTVSSTLKRLKGKGYLQMRKVGKKNKFKWNKKL